MVLLYLWTNLSGREHWWVRAGIKLCGSLELFNSSKKMTRQGQYVQQGLVSTSIANSRSPTDVSVTHAHTALFTNIVGSMTQPLESAIFSSELHDTHRRVATLLVVINATCIASNIIRKFSFLF